MATAQRRPETRRQENTQTEITRQIEQMRQITQGLQRVQLTPDQIEELKKILQSLTNVVKPPATATGGGASGTTTGQAPAPRRVEQFVYDVTVSGTTYRLTLSDRLPSDRQGHVDAAAARRRLHDALLHNEPVPLGGHMSASVQMTGNTQEAARFNAGPENQRMDIFRDRYVAQTYNNGQYVENNAITIAQVQGQRPRGG